MPSLRITDLDGNLVFETDMLQFWSLEEGSDPDGPHIQFNELIKLPDDEDYGLTTEIIEYAINEGDGGRSRASESFAIIEEEQYNGFAWDNELTEMDPSRILGRYIFSYNPNADL